MKELYTCIVCGDGGLVHSMVCEQCVGKYGSSAVGFQFLLQDIIERGYSVTLMKDEIQVFDDEDEGWIWSGVDLVEAREVVLNRG
jgi:hypothetical protein